MKKIILFVFLISCFMFKPIMEVSADAASPVITLYDAIVTNPKGARALSGKDLDLQMAYFENDELTKSVIPYNSVVIVTEEMGGMVLIEYNGKKYAIEEKDIVAKNETYPLDKATKLDKVVNVMTLYEVDVYSGPSEKFKKTASIPENIIIKKSYMTGYWIYVEYNNNKGWIRDKLVADESSVEISLLNDYKIGNMTIKKGTSLKCLYLYSDRVGEHCYIKYNDVTGWVDSYDIENDIDYFKLEEDEPYEEPNEEPSSNEPSSVEEPVILPESSDVEPSSNSEINDIESNVLLYVGAAFIVALTAIVTIIFLNKKNKNIEG